jgi:hypothetical protein
MFSRLNNRAFTTALFVLGLTASAAFLYPRIANGFSTRSFSSSTASSKSSSSTTMSTEGMTEQILRLQHPGTCTGKNISQLGKQVHFFN